MVYALKSRRQVEAKRETELQGPCLEVERDRKTETKGKDGTQDIQVVYDIAHNGKEGSGFSLCAGSQYIS